MNPTQLEELKKMSAGQIARKYTPMLMKKEITRAQFDKLISLASTSPEATERTEKNEKEESKDTISQFTTHEDESLGRTQKQKLKEVLKDGHWHDTVEILGRVYGQDQSGIARIAARISDLKKDGYGIESERKNGSIWQYRLVEQPMLVPDARGNTQSNVSERT